MNGRRPNPTTAMRVSLVIVIGLCFLAGFVVWCVKLATDGVN